MTGDGSPPEAGPDRPAVGDRLPLEFRWLWGGFGTSNLADGIRLAAAPLLVTSLTLDPLLVGLATAVQFAPSVLFSLLAGVVADRRDRRRLQLVGHVSRAVVLGVLAAAILTDLLSLPVVYATVFVLGTAEVFTDTAGRTLVQTTVPPHQHGVATSRLVGTRIVANDLAGPPLGALLFSLGVAVPFLTNVVLLLLAAVLIAQLRSGRVQRTDLPVADPEAGRLRAAWHAVRTDVVDGLRYVRRTPPVRRLAVLIAVFNLSFGATQGILVLWALQQLGLDERGYGLLLTATAAGGLLGSIVYPRLERRFHYAPMLRAGLLVETFTHAFLGATTSVWVAAPVLAAFGVHEAVWGSLSNAILLRVVPEEVFGRVTGAYRLAVVAPLIVGALVGGVLAEVFGLRAAFVYAFLGAGTATVWSWRAMDDLGAAGEHHPAPDPGA